MASLTGYMQQNAGISTENRLQCWYGSQRPGNYGYSPASTKSLTTKHANQGFFDCLDLVDEAKLSFMIGELGLYSLQELPDLRLMFGKASREKPLRDVSQMRMLRQWDIRDDTEHWPVENILKGSEIKRTVSFRMDFPIDETTDVALQLVALQLVSSI